VALQILKNLVNASFFHLLVKVVVPHMRNRLQQEEKKIRKTSHTLNFKLYSTILRQCSSTGRTRGR